MPNPLIIECPDKSFIYDCLTKLANLNIQHDPINHTCKLPGVSYILLNNESKTKVEYSTVFIIGNSLAEVRNARAPVMSVRLYSDQYSKENEIPISLNQENKIGRNDNHILLKEKHISRFHAVVQPMEDGVMLTNKS